MKTEKTSKINVFFLILLFCIAIVSIFSFASNLNYGDSCVQGDTCSIGTCVSDQNIPCDQTNPIFCGCCNSGEKWDSSVGNCVVVEWTVTKGDESDSEVNDSNTDNDKTSLKLVLLDDASLKNTEIDKKAPKIGEKGYCKYQKKKTGYLCNENEKGCKKDNECKNGLSCNSNTCVKKTNQKYPLSYNEGICNSNDQCSNHLFCTDEFGTDNVELGTCCYEWEIKDDKTGNCVLKSKEGDLDNDKNTNFGESKLYSNPINEKKKPIGTIFDSTCTNYFGEKDKNLVTLAAANTANYAAKKISWGVGIASGLKDDLMVIPDLAVVGYKITEGTVNGKINW